MMSEHKLVESFNERWITTLNNISNDNLRQSWNNTFNAFDEVVKRNSSGDKPVKMIIPSPTGTGKSQNVIHYVASLYYTDTRSLIVVQRTQDADEIREGIAIAVGDAGYAETYHSKETSTTIEPSSAKCLIITHERFKRNHSEDYIAYRDFIVVDEELSAVDLVTVEMEELKRIKKVLNRLNVAHNDQLVLDGLIKAFAKIKKLDGSFKGGTRLPFAQRDPSLLEFAEAKKAITESKMDLHKIIAGGRTDERGDKDFRNRMLFVLEDLKEFKNEWSFTTKQQGDIFWHTTKDILPSISLAIMDATATVNYAYELHQQYRDNLIVLPKIECRRYDNVELFTSRINAGRETITQTVKIEAFVESVLKNTNAGDKILIVSFKKFDDVIMTYTKAITDREIYVEHWGNLTGTNKFNQCDTVFLFGLNYKPAQKYHATNILAKGTDKAFDPKNTKNRQDLKLLKIYDLIAEVIQAMNRTRMRNVAYEDGNCLAAKVFLTLPTDPLLALRMTSSIEDEMKGIKISHWKLHKTSEEKLARVSLAESFIDALHMLLEDTIEVSLYDVLNHLELKMEQWRTNIKNKETFIDGLKLSPFSMTTRARINRRGQKLKTKDIYFIAEPKTVKELTEKEGYTFENKFITEEFDSYVEEDF